MVANPKTFPSGIKALADYVHGKGLKLGLYSSAGTRTCSDRMRGSLGHEDTDAKNFASWGADYLKYDNCYRDGTPETVRFPRMSRALKNSGRPIFYSLCEWGYMEVAKWGGASGNSWRTTGDIKDTWTGMLDNIDPNDAYAQYAKPAGWNDPDMLEVGNGGMTYDEYVVHFSLWAIAKAPPIICCDVTSIPKETLGILEPRSQSEAGSYRLGIQGKKVRKYGDDHEVQISAFLLLMRKEGNSPFLFALSSDPETNPCVAYLCGCGPGGSPGTGRRCCCSTAAWPDVGIRPGVAVEARDVWKHEALPGKFTGSLSFTAAVEPHSCKLFVLTPVPR
ncbi:hypothetical protein GQ55_7G321400 [Panicum hallii var. hallii]|uniref:Alpha-galactosidase n=1 Tax=Panicum hallii var. hallii TaxID=1504633 RepID=A0A2T7D1F9_9POAL|nr:hypothetical protein GQ55_7G321400 [Panicum hallii var. hallii]